MAHYIRTVICTSYKPGCPDNSMASNEIFLRLIRKLYSNPFAKPNLKSDFFSLTFRYSQLELNLAPNTFYPQPTFGQTLSSIAFGHIEFKILNSVSRLKVQLQKSSSTASQSFSLFLLSLVGHVGIFTCSVLFSLCCCGDSFPSQC